MERQSKTKRVTRKKNDSTVSAGSVENSGQRSLHTETVMSGSSRSGEHDSEKKRPITAEEADRRFNVEKQITIARKIVRNRRKALRQLADIVAAMSEAATGASCKS